MRRVSRVLTVLAVAMGLHSGCTLLDLRTQTIEYYQATVVVGQVIPPPGWSGPIVVAALSPNAEVAHDVWLHEPGGYELIVPPGQYTVLAFGDANRNGRLDAGEPAGSHPAIITASGSGTVAGADLRLSTEASATQGTSLSGREFRPRHSTQAGAVADLANAAFTAESGRAGYWSPLEAFRQSGGNVYFREPYDPARVPVLFIHGASGSAQDFRYLFDQLDRRYQAWFFQYPSGAPLDSMSHLLFWKLLNLQMRLRFERVHLVAHSMGGLLARRFVINHASQFPQMGALVTLSTPWGGERSAATGVRLSPAVIPSWRDMQPDGTFLASLFQQPLPAGVRHTLLFGHRGGHHLLGQNTDGTVTLASQLRPEAQSQAAMVMGFDEDHVSILSAPAVSREIHRALEAGDTSRHTGDGRLRVELSYTDTARSLSVSTMPFLFLTPAEISDAQISLPLTHRSGAAEIGPVAPGRYHARLLAHGFRSVPAPETLTVDSTGTASLRIQLEPQGVLANYIGVDGDSADFPAGSLRPPHSGIVVERIELRGMGQTRVLRPLLENEAEVWDAYLDGKDGASGPLFSFVNLDPGEYELEIRARGYHPYLERCRVEAGAPAAAAPIVLRRL